MNGENRRQAFILADNAPARPVCGRILVWSSCLPMFKMRGEGTRPWCAAALVVGSPIPFCFIDTFPFQCNQRHVAAPRRLSSIRQQSMLHLVDYLLHYTPVAHACHCKLRFGPAIAYAHCHGLSDTLRRSSTDGDFRSISPTGVFCLAIPKQRTPVL